MFFNQIWGFKIIKIKISVSCIATAKINNILSNILNVSAPSEVNAVRQKKFSHFSCCVNNVVWFTKSESYELIPLMNHLNQL